MLLQKHLSSPRHRLETPSSPEQSSYEDMRLILLTASQDVEQRLAWEFINANWMRGAPSIL